MKLNNTVKCDLVSQWRRRTCYLLYRCGSCTLGCYRHRKVVLLAQVVVRDLVNNDVPVTLKCLLDVGLAGGQRISFGTILYDHKTNDSICRELQTKRILDKIGEYRWNWLRHF
jgi:hypothetical protein